MMDSFWVASIEISRALIAPISALVGAFGGAHIANKRAERAAESERIENRKRDVREIAVELVQSGYEWASSGLGYTMGQLALRKNGALASDERGMEDGRKLVDARNRHLAAFSRFTLTVSDTLPLESVQALRTKMNSTVELTSPLLGATNLAQPIDVAAVTAAFDHFDTYRKDLDAFETLLQPFVSGKLTKESSKQK
jgi:hypothetical protein